MAIVGGGVVGLIIVSMRISKRKLLRRAAAASIGLFQGTPLLLQLFIIFFGFPMIGVRIEAWTVAALVWPSMPVLFWVRSGVAGWRLLTRANGMAAPH